MGYYTRYKLDIQGDSPSLQEVALEIAGGDLAMAVTYDEVLRGGDEVKWYDHDNDMKEVSLRWTETLFVLDGEGEENGDVWRKYWRGGKVQIERQPEWKPPPFDPAKLA